MIEQLILHLLGDYVIQNNTMAQRKTSSYLWAFIHAITYSLPFLLLTKGFNLAWFVIFITHFLIDRFRLARYWIMFYNIHRNKVCKIQRHNQSEIQNDSFVYEGNVYYILKDLGNNLYKCIILNDKEKQVYKNWVVDDTPTGFNSSTPPFLSTWLLIIIDNTFHIIINYLSLTYLM